MSLFDRFGSGRRRRRAQTALAGAAAKGAVWRFHHHIFDRFTAFEGEVPLDFHVCYLGDRFRTDVVDWPVVRKEARVWPRLPAYDEEYFEWIDVLEAVDEAGDVFTMLELGAGFGRWSARGALAARQRGKPVRLGLAEADPRHIGWIRRNMADNGVATGDYRIFPAAVAGTHGQATFAVGKPAAEGETEWFGQSVVEGRPGAVVGDYHGAPLVALDGGWTGIVVPQVPLSEILGCYGLIDLADFDLQGCEADAIEEAIRPLTRQVRRLHIGTHGPQIEARLRQVLGRHGWVCLRDFAVGQDQDTPFGRMGFVDGVQSWLNPRL